jgi:uncharacterized membrane protein SpoIIM required for sporulation
MIIEAFLNPQNVNKEKNIFFIIGLVYTSIAILLSIIVFKHQASMVMVFFTVMAIMPYIFNSIKHEENEDLVLKEEKSMLTEHAKTLYKFMLVFCGVVVAFVIWFVVLPPDTVHEIFSVQLQTINSINSEPETTPTGNFFSTAYFVSNLDIFQQIVMNNLVVLFFCLIFSFLYGFGAIFILTWNASVIGAAIGTNIDKGLESAAALLGFDKIAMYFNVISYGLLRYAFHGIPEILAYFVAGLAGGIISVAAIKHDFRSKKYSKIIIDSADLVMIAIFLIFLSGFVEVYVTPLFF